MTLFKPVWMQPAVGDSDLQYPASEFRQLIMALAAGGRGVIAPTVAVVTHNHLGANFSVDIAPFQAIIDGTDVTDQGSYLVTNTSQPYNLATPSAPSLGTRTHRLVAQVRDKRANPLWTVYDWVPMIVQGTDQNGAEPPLPPSACTLAHISIAAGQANIQDSHITQGYTVLRDLQNRGPWVSNQQSPGSWNDTGTWHDFTGGQWPAVSFTVPPSGKVLVSVSGSARPHGVNCCLGWRISGGNTVGNDYSHAARLGGSGVSGLMFRATARRLVTGLTPGATDTVTPTWYTTDTSDSDDGDGQLLVEAVQ